MNIPGFTADASFHHSTTSYFSGGYQRTHSLNSQTGNIIPAIPFCGNCDYILDNCSRNGWRPRAVCNACFYGNCYSGVEDPTPNDPYSPHPGQYFLGL